MELRVLMLLTGGVIAGEALALLVGMALLSPRLNAWLTARNLLWLGLDLVCGGGQ
jgi:hypothetical protein